MDESFEDLKEDMMQIVRSHLRPEFVNRIDEIIVFRELTQGADSRDRCG